MPHFILSIRMFLKRIFLRCIKKKMIANFDHFDFLSPDLFLYSYLKNRVYKSKDLKDHRILNICIIE